MARRLTQTEIILQSIAKSLDETLKPNGFVLMVFDQNKTENRVNYISNVSRDQIKEAIAEINARFNGKPN